MIYVGKCDKNITQLFAGKLDAHCNTRSLLNKTKYTSYLKQYFFFKLKHIAGNTQKNGQKPVEQHREISLVQEGLFCVQII